ncbi:GapR family DNA-binding domain-containing protein [Azospirillum sp. 11R-A]|uniref:DUF2312 domain-containing protein n=1 Tax=Azospirillum sp. 11R-A TaxID=3111634 RepID=UPI003C2A2040
MGRPRIGTPEEAAERKRQQTASRVRRLRARRAEALATTPPADAPPAPVVPVYMSSPIASMRILGFVEGIERLETELAAIRSRNPTLAAAYATERAAIQSELKAVWKELEDTGFSAAATREILRLRKMDDADRRELEATVALYKQALGMD